MVYLKYSHAGPQGVEYSLRDECVFWLPGLYKNIAVS